MKKNIFVAVSIVLLLTSLSYAQTRRASANYSKSSNMAIGVDNGYSALKFFTGNMDMSVGTGFFSSSGNNAFSVLGKITSDLSKGVVKPHFGGAVEFTSANNFSSFTIRGLYGAETTIANDLNIGFDIYPISYTSQSAGGATSTQFSLGGGSVYVYYIF